MTTSTTSATAFSGPQRRRFATLRRLVKWLAPPGSRRRDWIYLTRRTLVHLRRNGPLGVWKAYRQWQIRRANGVIDIDLWLRESDPTPETLVAQRDWAKNIETPLVITLITPLYRTPVDLLRDTVKSVQDQSYPYWELCLAVADDENPELRTLANQMAAADPRIKVATMPTNRGISDASNVALTVATGDYVAVLDHDDLLAPHALFECAQYLKRHPETDMVYSDEDFVSADGRRRYRPVLKPDFSPAFLLSCNYICHFAATRHSLIKQIGGFRSKYDGAQDWDLFLRISDLTSRIAHLPKILYHWRAVPTSCASGIEAKPYVIEAQKNVLVDHFARRELQATAQIQHNNTSRVEWDPGRKPLVSIVIPTKNQLALIQECLDGLTTKTNYKNIEIIVVDTGSDDPSVHQLYARMQQNHRIKVLNWTKPFNFSAACNFGASAANGELLLFLNNDIEVIEATWLDELVRWGLEPKMGVVGARLLFPDGKLQHNGVILGPLSHFFYHQDPDCAGVFGPALAYRDLLAVTGACQLVPREVFQEIGGFDEQYAVDFSDIELCLRIHARGYRIAFTPYATLIHHECSTRERCHSAEDVTRFANFLRQLPVAQDPFCHERLSGHSWAPMVATLEGEKAFDVYRAWLEGTLARNCNNQAEYLRKAYRTNAELQRIMPEALITADPTAFFACLKSIDFAASESDRRDFRAYLLSPLEDRVRETIAVNPRFRNLAIQSPSLPSSKKSFSDDVKASVQNAIIPWRQDSSQQLKEGVNLIGHCGYSASLGTATRGLKAALQSTSLPYSTHNVPYSFGTEDFLGLDHYQPLIHKTSIVSVDLKALGTIYQEWKLDVHPSRYRIATGHWSPNAQPKDFAHLQAFDEVWCPSEFVANIFREHSKRSVHVLPHALPPCEPDVLSRAEFGIPEHPKLIYVSADLSQPSSERAPLAAIEAIRLAFGASDEIFVVMKVSRASEFPERYRQLQLAARGLPVWFLTAKMKQSRVLGLMNLCDCHISLHQATNFGMSVAEAMQLGKPVIATAYSGNMMFMNKQNSLLVDYRLQSSPPNGIAQAVPEVAHAADHLRWIMDHPHEAAALGRIAQRDVETELSPQRVGTLIANRLASGRLSRPSRAA